MAQLVPLDELDEDYQSPAPAPTRRTRLVPLDDLPSRPPAAAPVAAAVSQNLPAAEPARDAGGPRITDALTQALKERFQEPDEPPVVPQGPRGGVLETLPIVRIRPRTDTMTAAPATAPGTPFGDASLRQVVSGIPGAFTRELEQGRLYGQGLVSHIAGDTEGVLAVAAEKKRLEAAQQKARAGLMQGGEVPGVIKAAEALPGSLAMMAGFLGGGIPGGLLAIQPQVVDKYRDYRKLGNSPFEAFAAAQGVGLAEVLPERISWGLLKNLFNLPATSSKGRVLRALGIQQVGEHAEEQITNVAEYVLDKIMNDPTATVQKLIADAKEAAQVTAYLAPVIGGGALATGKLAQAAANAYNSTAAGRARVLARELQAATEEGAPATEPTEPTGERMLQRFPTTTFTPEFTQTAKPTVIPPGPVATSPTLDERPEVRLVREIENLISPEMRAQAGIDEGLAALAAEQPLPNIEGAREGFPARKGFPRINLKGVPDATGERVESIGDQREHLGADVVLPEQGPYRLFPGGVAGKGAKESYSDRAGQGAPEPIAAVGVGRFRRPLFNQRLGEIDRAAGLAPAADTNVAQSEWLAQKASEAGYGDVDTMAQQAPGLFRKLTEQWREEHPVAVGVKAADLVRRDAGGRIIGGFGAEHLNAVNATLRRMATLAKEGKVGRTWYEDSAREILRVVGGDRTAADRIAQVLAITSAGTEVKSNFTMASNALQQYARGEPIKVATGDKNKDLNDLLYHGIVPKSIKVDDFYRNLAQHITGAQTPRAVTDRWQFRIASGDQAQEKGTAQQYAYTSKLVDEAARRLGWRTDEAQAAMWVAMKARSAFDRMKKSVRESENSKYAGVSDKELRRIALEMARTSFASEIQQRNWAPPAGATFPSIDELRAAHQTITAEVKPSTKTEIGERAALLDQSQMGAFQARAIAQIGGVESFMQAFGLGPTQYTAHRGAGTYEGGIAPNMIISVRAPKGTVDQIARGWMYVFKQDAVPYFRADKSLADNADATRGVFVTASNVTPARERKFFDHLRSAVHPGVGYTQDGNTFLILNFHGQPVGEFLDKLNAALTSPENPVTVSKAVHYGAESEYPQHDWQAEPTGRSLLDQASAGQPPDLRARLRSWADSFERLAQRELPAGPERTGRVAPEEQGAGLVAVGVRAAPASTKEFTARLDLSPEYKAARESARHVFADYESAKAAYEAQPDSHGGRVLNPDIASELVPEYAANRELASAVHDPASAFVKRYYQERLARPVAEGKMPVVVLTAGGPGSGKSYSIKTHFTDALESADLIYDSSLSRLGSAKEKVERALASGREVDIYFVNRNPVAAYEKGVLNRVDEGLRRIVPADEHARSHVEARTVLRQLEKLYKGDKRVHINVIDNGGGARGAGVSDVARIWPMNYNAVHESVKAALQRAQQNGRITGAQLNAALTPFNQSVEEEGGGQHRGEPQPRAGQEVTAVGARSTSIYPEPKTITGNPALVGMARDTVLDIFSGQITRFISNPSERQRELIAGALTDLEANGLPRYLTQRVTGWFLHDARNSNAASFYPHHDAISIAEREMELTEAKILPKLRSYVAHELGHRLDATEKNRAERAGHYDAFSHYSPRMEFYAVHVPVPTFGAMGDLMQEAMSAYWRGPAALRDFLTYPLDGIFENDASMIKSEVFAQMHALYFTARGTMQQYAPLWHEVMEGIYAGNQTEQAQGVQGDPFAAARARLQQALQVESTDGRIAPAGRESQPANLSVPRRGQAEPGVGERAAARAQPAARGPQRDATDGRGPVAIGVRGQRGAGWNVDQPGTFDAVARALQDYQIDLKRVEAAIKEAGGAIPSESRPYLTEELYRDRANDRTRRFWKGEVEPLLKAMKSEGINPAELDLFLWARHAPEANAQLARSNNGQQDLAGMSNTTAAQVMSDFRRDRKYIKLVGLGAMFDRITAGTRRTFVAEDLHTQADIDQWERTYKHYAPLYRDTDTAGEGTGFRVTGPESKRRTGSTRPVVDILSNAVLQRERAHLRAEKARVGRDLIKLAEQFPNPDFWRVDSPPTRRIVDPRTGLVSTQVDPQWKNREDVFIVKAKDASGQIVERAITFNKANERALRLSHAMQRLDAAEIGAATKVVGHVSRYFANLATQWNPVFWVSNFVRDIGTAIPNLQSTPLKGRTMRVLSRVPQALAGITDAEFRDGNSRWAQHYHEYQEHGAQIQWRQLWEDTTDHAAHIGKLIDASGRGKMDPRVWAKATADTVQKTNLIIENGVRLAAFVTAREQGLSPREAASIAKNLTVNFRRKGNVTPNTNAWYMFFNANVQGMARLTEALAKSPRAWAIVGAYTAFGAALELLNRMIGDRDRDEAGNNPYELVGEWEKQRNFIVMKPGRKEKGEAGYWKLPLPYGFNIFPNAGRLATEAVLNASKRVHGLVTQQRDALEMAADYANVVMDAFSPLGQTNTALQFLAPTIADPIVQIAENKKFTGAPLVPERGFHNRQLPRSQLYFNSDSEIAKDLAAWLNRVSGGNEIKPGEIDVHPGHIQHIFQTLTGGPGTFAMGLFDAGKAAMDIASGKPGAEMPPPSRIPFVGKFYGEVDERAIEQKFYRIKEKSDKAIGQLKAAKKAGDTDLAEEIEAKNEALIEFGREVARPTFKRERKAGTEEMKGTRELPISDRERAKREIKRDQSQLYLRALEAYNEAARESSP